MLTVGEISREEHVDHRVSVVGGEQRALSENAMAHR